MELEVARRKHGYTYSSSYAYPWHEMGRVINTMPRPQEGETVPRVHKAGRGLGLVWTGAENPFSVKTETVSSIIQRDTLNTFIYVFY
jgi:hypothetical protein